MNKKKNRMLIISSIIIVASIFTIIKSQSKTQINEISGIKANESEKIQEENDDAIELKNEEQEKNIEIVSVGNIIVHDEQLKGAKNQSGYDFSPSFEYVKDIISKADLSIGCLETTFAGGTPTGYPLFNTPDEFLNDLKDTGLDVLNLASNHIIDSRYNGLVSTIEKAQKAQFDILGVKKEQNDKNYIIKDVQGEKIGLIAYTYETDPINGTPTINSNKIPSQALGLINTFNYDKLNVFYENMSKEINSMKEEGAEFIIANIHWGDEYVTTQNQIQMDMARKLNELGVDIIIGSHPHVVQPYEVIKGNSGKETLVIYSQGNFLSNQCNEELGMNEPEDGIIFRITLQKKDDVISLKNYEIIPTWVYREKKQDNTFYHRIIPAEDAVTNAATYNLTDEAYLRVKNSLERTKNTIGKN